MMSSAASTVPGSAAQPATSAAAITSVHLCILSSRSIFGLLCGIDMGLARERRGFGRDHESDHLPRDLRLLRHGQERNARRARLVHRSGRYADIVGSGNSDHDVGLLQAELE